jgi:hypothetical protein
MLTLGVQQLQHLPEQLEGFLELPVFEVLNCDAVHIEDELLAVLFLFVH